ncbi:MAG: hypothetical protein M3447_07595 [Acidobacteriota bacterium]|nr:hypothetical protein [Acidobacteriota bacterium]
MSTPGPQQNITLPGGKLFTVLIDSLNYPSDFPAELTFTEDLVSLEWTAAYSVPSVLLSQLNCPVTQAAGLIEFGFEMRGVTEDQKKAGYIDGPYSFTFVPPGGVATQFSGEMTDPRPEQAEDTFTARGNEADTSKSY